MYIIWCISIITCYWYFYKVMWILVISYPLTLHFWKSQSFMNSVMNKWWNLKSEILFSAADKGRSQQRETLVWSKTTFSQANAEGRLSWSPHRHKWMNDMNNELIYDRPNSYNFFFQIYKRSNSASLNENITHDFFWIIHLIYYLHSVWTVLSLIGAHDHTTYYMIIICSPIDNNMHTPSIHYANDLQ